MAKHGGVSPLVFILGLLVLAFAMGWINFRPQPGGTIVTVPGVPIAPTETEFKAYNLGLTYQERQAGDAGSVTTGTPTYSGYHSNGRRLSGLASLYGEQGLAIASGTTATNFPISKTDADFIFIRIDTGTTDYPDVAKILAAGAPHMTGIKAVHVNSPTTKQMVAEIQLSKIGGPNYNINPSLTMPTLLISVWLDDLAVTISAPADQDNQGITAGTDVYINWQLTDLAANQGFGFGRVGMTSNQTTAFMEVVSLTIVASTDIIEIGTGRSLGREVVLTPVVTGATTAGVAQAWRFFPSGRDSALDETQAYMIGRGTAQADLITFRVNVRVSFTATTNAVTAVIGIRLISADNVLQTEGTDPMIIGG